MKPRLCSACAADEHRCLRVFSCTCEICRRAKPKKSTQETTSFQVEGDFLIEDVLA